MCFKTKFPQKSAMSDIFISYAREDRPRAQQTESPCAPVEIKIPQRVVNLPVIPASILRNIVLLVLTVIALVSGGYCYSFLQQ